MDINKVVSIDLGYDRCGVAVIEKKPGNKEKVLYSCCIETDKNESFAQRLFLVIKNINKIISDHKPNFVVLEKIFFANNKKTAMNISAIRGAILFSAKNENIDIVELNPNEIKLAVTGDGKSSKNQVIKMIQLITGFDQKVKDDEHDAIAIGIAFFALYRPGITEVF